MRNSVGRSVLRGRRSSIPACILLAAMSFTVTACSRSKSSNPPATAAGTSQPGTPAQDGTAAAPAQGAAAPSPAGSAPAPSGAAQATPGAGATPSAAAPGTPAAQAGRPSPAQAAITIPAGTELRVRIDQHISVKTTRAGERFTGTIVSPVSENGAVVIPDGSAVGGVVRQAHHRGRFKGASVLQLALTSVDVNGQHYQIGTSSLTRTKKGKGKRTAAFIGGGTGLGMLIGGVATGGVGLLVGGLAGAGAGTAGAAFTGNRDLDLPAESVISFRLTEPLTLR